MMRRGSNSSIKPFQSLPNSRRSSFNGGFEGDLSTIIASDAVYLEQQQAMKKSPRKMTFNTNITPMSNAKPVIGGVTSPMMHPLSNNSINSLQNQEPQQNLPSNLYKTELCRSFEETGTCRYGNKCQFAHGLPELRPAPRHPKYKTEICKTFHSIGTCPYGTRCRFIHTSPSDSIEWITGETDNAAFEGDQAKATTKETVEEPVAVPTVVPVATITPTFTTFMPRVQPQSTLPYASISAFNEPFTTVRSEIPPRLETSFPYEPSRTLTERPNHKHRLPVFRELCHQSSVERLQQQVLDFVFEKEQ